MLRTAMNHPLSPNEPHRLSALRELDILDSLPQAVFDNLTELAASICNAPMALVSLVDAERQWFKARHGIDIAQTSRDESFCSYTILDTDQVLVVEDARRDERFAHFPMVRNGQIAFYAGAAITTTSGYPLGALCVLDRESRELEPEQIRQLQRLADLAINLIENEAHRRKESRLVLDLVRKNEHIVKSVLDEGREMCSYIDNQHRYLFVNPAFERYWIQQREALIGMPVRDLVGKDLYQQVFKPGLNQALAGQETMARLSYVYPGVGERHMEVRHVPARDPNGSISGVVERYRDVTELTHQAIDLRSHVLKLDSSRLAQQRYLHLISHDLKEPINAICSSVAVLRSELDTKLSPLETQCLTFISRGGSRLSRLLEDLRLFSEMDSEGLQVECLPAAQILDRVVDNLRDEVDRRKAKVELFPQGDLVVHADLFEMAVRCVIETLLRSSPQATPHLQIHVKQSSESTILECLDLADRAAFPPIVDPGASTARVVSSEGPSQRAVPHPLALSTAVRILGAHHAQLHEKTTPEQRRCFTISVPHRPPNTGSTV